MGILNLLFVGAQVDYEARYWTRQLPPIFAILDCCFCIYFVVELILRLFSDECGFLLRLDLILVTLQVIDQTSYLLHLSLLDSTPAWGLRVMRLARMLRCLRAL